MITREFDLMLYQEGNLLFINANQYDSGEQWIFTLYEENGVKYTPATGAIVGVKSDGKGIINTGTVDEYGRVVINETQQMTAAAGLATFELLIDNDTHGTANFKVDVEPRPADNADLSDSDLSLIQEAVNSATEIIGLLDGETVDEKLLPIVQSETGDWLTDHITNPSNPPIDTSLTVAGAAADAKATGDEISDLKTAISNHSKGIDTFKEYGNFQHYGLLLNGTFKTDQQYRVSNDDPMTFDRDLKVSVASGFKWGYILFEDGTAGTWSGWFTKDKIITAGTTFVVQISRETENTSEIANVDYFTSQVTFPTVIGEDVIENRNGINVLYSEVEALANGKTEQISETVTQGMHTAQFTSVIPKDTALTIYNTSTTTGCSVNLIDVDGNEQSCGNINPQNKVEITTSFDAVSVRSYVNGTDWKLKFAYGYNTESHITSLGNKLYEISDSVGAKLVENTLSNGTPQNSGNSQCVQTSDFIPVSPNDTVTLFTDRPVSSSAEKYIYGVYVYNSNKTLIYAASPTDRSNETSEYKIVQTQAAYIKYAFTEIDDQESIISLRVDGFIGYEVYAIVNSNSQKETYIYEYNGEFIPVKAKKYNVVTTELSAPLPSSVNATNLQGFAIYGDKIVQCYNSDKIAIIDMTTNTAGDAISVDINHGNTIDFFNEKENESDVFPYALIADGLSNEAYKVKIEDDQATIIQTLKFTVERCGYYVSTAIDNLNNIIYTVGYYQNSYTSSTNNKMIIAKWDYSDLTQNGDGSYTPAFVESFYLPFMTTQQGPTFYNGRLFIVSSYPSQTEANTIIYVVDVFAKRISSILDKFVSDVKNYEVEAIYFYGDDVVSAYLRSANASLNYHRIDFND